MFSSFVGAIISTVTNGRKMTAAACVKTIALPKNSVNGYVVE